MAKAKTTKKTTAKKAAPKTTPKTYKQKADELTFDPNNVNKHTVRGLEMLDDSLKTLGAGRSIVTDASGTVLAGNATLEKAIEQGIEVLTIETDGNTLINVKRTDIKKGSSKGKDLALADNRVGQVNLLFDKSKIKKLYNQKKLAKYDFNNLVGDVDINNFFEKNTENNNNIKEKHFLVLEFKNKEEYENLINRINEYEGTKEEYILSLL